MPAAARDTVQGEHEGLQAATSALGKEAKPAPLFVDNQAATQIAKDPVTANNMKHVARRHFYVREMQELGLVRICWWHGKGNEADALTKALPKARHRSLVKNFFDLDRGLKRDREEAVREAYRDPPEGRSGP